MKRCSKCKAEKSVDEFSKEAKAKDGLRSTCKDCRAEYMAAYKANPKNKAKAKAYCARPEVKVRRAASKAKYMAKPENRAKAAASKAVYRAVPKNKAKEAASRAAYILKPEYKARVAGYRAKPAAKAKASASNAVYRDRPENKARAKANAATPESKARVRASAAKPENNAKKKVRGAAYYARPEVKARMKVYYASPEVKARARAWRATPKRQAARKLYLATPEGREAIRAAVSRRRAKLEGCEVEKFTHREIFERDKYYCQRCGVKTQPKIGHHHILSPELDHIAPISKGGPHTKLNTQCLCRACNMSKHARLEKDFQPMLRMKLLSTTKGINNAKSPRTTPCR